MKAPLLSLLLLAGCAAASAGGEDIPARGQGGACNAEPAQGLIGRAASAELGTEAMRRSRATTMRWIGPDQMVTMDFRPDRLNIELDAQNRVVRIRCG